MPASTVVPAEGTMWSVLWSIFFFITAVVDSYDKRIFGKRHQSSSRLTREVEPCDLCFLAEVSSALPTCFQKESSLLSGLTVSLRAYHFDKCPSFSSPLHRLLNIDKHWHPHRFIHEIFESHQKPTLNHIVW